MSNGSRKKKPPAVDLATIEGIRALLHFTTEQTLEQENTSQRSKALLQCAQVGLQLVEADELAARIAALEEVMQRHPPARLRAV